MFVASCRLMLPWMAFQIVERFSGQVPRTFEELESLPGVGHKTASVIMSQCFGHAAFAVDTHVHRLALRWGEEGRDNHDDAFVRGGRQLTSNTLNPCVCHTCVHFRGCAGLSKSNNVDRVQQDLITIFPEDQWSKLHLQFIYMGREHCTAKDHAPSSCPICSWINNPKGTPPDDVSRRKAVDRCHVAMRPLDKCATGCPVCG